MTTNSMIRQIGQLYIKPSLINPVIDRLVGNSNYMGNLFRGPLLDLNLFLDQVFKVFSERRLPPPLTNLLFKVSLRSEELTSELQSRFDLVCRLLLEKKKVRMDCKKDKYSFSSTGINGSI